MNQTMHQAIDQPLPTIPELVRATLIALVVAIGILITWILPAEYGIDPIGIGKVLGLTQLSAPATTNDEVQPAKSLALEEVSVVRAETPLQSDTVSIVLPAYEGTELKGKMVAGQSFVFSWSTANGEALYTDMHGEPFGATGDEFTTYWKERAQSAGEGTFIARFDGTHGWYWQNMTDEDVVINVKVHGFYDDIYQPGG